jgi:hypothetical protein
VTRSERTAARSRQSNVLRKPSSTGRCPGAGTGLGARRVRLAVRPVLDLRRPRSRRLSPTRAGAARHRRDQRRKQIDETPESSGKLGALHACNRPAEQGQQRANDGTKHESVRSPPLRSLISLAYLPESGGTGPPYCAAAPFRGRPLAISPSPAAPFSSTRQARCEHDRTSAPHPRAEPPGRSQGSGPSTPFAAPPS